MRYRLLFITPHMPVWQALLTALAEANGENALLLRISDPADERREVLAFQPDVILLDVIQSPEETLPERLRALEEAGASARFFFLCGQDTDRLLQLPLHRVDGIYPPPFPADRICRDLRQSFHRIDRERLLTAQSRYWHISGQLFLHHGRILNPDNQIPVSMVNEMFGFAFRDDAYRMIVLTIDERLSGVPLPNIFSERLSYFADLLYQRIAPLCHESAMRISVKRIHILINYPDSRDDELIAALQQWVRATSLSLPQGQTLFLCSSDKHADIRDIGIMAEESMDATWLRFGVSAPSIVTIGPGDHWLPPVRQYCEQLLQKIEHACTVLDGAELEGALQQLFSLPRKDLCQVETRTMLRRIENGFFTINRHLLSEFLDYEETRQDMIKTVQLSNSFEEYRDAFTARLLQLFRLLSDRTGGQQSKHIRIAKQYILNHISEPLHLSDVAAVVDLNPAYLSYCFKREAGCNFSDYINQCRVELAREWLAGDRMKIQEMAERLGYNNSRYFSRTFKKYTGVSPREYRDSKADHVKKGA